MTQSTLSGNSQAAGESQPDDWWTTAHPAHVRDAALELARLDALGTVQPLFFAALLTAALWWGLFPLRPRWLSFIPLLVAGSVSVWRLWKWWRVGATPSAAIERVALHAGEMRLEEDIDLRLLPSPPIGTYLLLAALLVTACLELGTGGLRHAVTAAGLMKPETKSGQWWRLLSATYLHANLTHLLMNGGALLALGRVVEAYDRRLRLPLAYLASGLTGSIASVLVFAKPSVGASGAIMGLAGYLAVVASRIVGHGPALRRWMVRALGGTALLGLAAFVLIDNAGHVGGAMGGVLVGVLSLRERSEPLEPARAAGDRSRALTRALDAAGWLSWWALLTGALFTAMRLLLVP